MDFIKRIKNSKTFSYKGASKEDLERINSLKIPPNWTNVKIDKSSKANLQATGYDSKGRKQYIYNKEYVERNKKLKFNKINSFDHSKYSRVVRHYMAKNDLSKECIIANVLKLMEELNIRVGNDFYKKENGSHGITTLLKKHFKNETLTFIGKKGILHNKSIKNPLSLQFIDKMLKIRGENLFQYGENNNLTSSDLNSFLKEKVQSNITCKDIRTYCANKIFKNFMNSCKKGLTPEDRNKNILEGIKYTANELGNTTKVCKEAYLCPKIMNTFR